MVSLSNFDTTGNDITKVNVEGINEKALSGIRNAILATKNSIDRQSAQLRDQHDDEEENYRSEQIASLAKQRQDRATWAALYGKVDKGISAIDSLKDVLKSALDKLTDMVSDAAANALKSYDETARQLKALHLSSEDRKAEILKANKAQLLLQERGIIMQSSELNSVSTQLASAGFDPRNLTEDMLATVAVGIKSGMDPVLAANRAMEAKNQEALQEAWVKAYNFTGNKTFLATNKLLDEHKAALMVHLERTGQQQEEFQLELAKNAQSMDKLLNGFVDPEDQAKMLEHVMLLDSKQIEKVDENMISQLLGIAPEIYKNSNNKNELILQAMQKAIATGNTEMLNVLNQSVGGDSKIIEGLMSASRAAAANPEKFAERLQEVQDDNKENFNSNTEGGKITAFVNGLITKANVFTSKWFDGGIFGSAAVELNDLFGDQVGVENITKTGFTEVIKILKDAASNGWGTISAKLAKFSESVPGKIVNGILGFLPGILLKLVTGSGPLGWIFKGLKFLFPVIAPALATIGAVASVAYASYKIATTASRLSKPDDLKKEARQNDEELKALEARKAEMEKYGADAESIADIEKQITEHRQKKAQLDKDIQQAEDDAKSDSVKNVEAAEKKWEAERKKKIKEANNLQRMAMNARQAGDEEAYKKFMQQHDEKMKEVDDENAKLNKAREASRGFLASTFDLSVESLIAWQEFCDNFSEDWDNFWASAGELASEVGDNILNFFTKIGDDIANWWENFSISDLLPSIPELTKDNWLTWPFAQGGIVSSPTNALIGEAGKEVVLPLTKPDRLKELLGGLSAAEKSLIMSALNSSNNSPSNVSTASQNTAIQSNSSVPGNDAASINKILSYSSNPGYVYDSLRYGRNKDGSLKSKDPEYGNKKREAWYKESLQNAQNREGYELIKGTWAERALAWGASQIGLPYLLRSIGKLGYVCNELTNAALLGSGYDLKDFRIHGVKTTFANISAGKMVSGKDRKGRTREYPSFRLRPDITPETAIPGMLFFQDSSKNKDGQFAPGHVGLVYYGHQRLHSAGGSGSYDSPAAFLDKYQTPCRGVTVNEFDPNARYMFGELPGLFEQASGDWEPPKNSPVEFGPTDVDTTGNNILKEQSDLSKSAICSVIDKVSKFYNADMQKYAKQTAEAANSGNAKEIISFMEIMVKYLRDIATSPANKKPAISPSRPIPNKY